MAHRDLSNRPRTLPSSASFQSLFLSPAYPHSTCAIRCAAPMHYGKFGELLVQLKAGAYKVVQVKAKEAVKTLPGYDEAIMKEFGNNVSARPTASVVRTLRE
jgi:hypothetical protein